MVRPVYPEHADPSWRALHRQLPELSITVETENLDHYNSDRGVREKDESIALQTDRNGSFTTDNVDPENLALFFFGSTTALTDAGGTVEGEAIGPVEVGLTYQLGVSANNPAGVRNVSAVAVTDGDATTYVLDTDYALDAELGRITILAGGAITDEAALEADYTTEASTRERIVSGSQAIEGQLRYISYNPAGKQFDYLLPWVKITPNGDFALKGDEWQTIPFSVEVLKKGNMQAVYIDGRPMIA
ncbi:phage tail tube protein [Neoaquamicrobium sediminum]|uniref:phage tail tube protein n=1 Tax=Neoaquamicrobium sediminum TaxID=1849104 RepID=UPI0019D5BCAB|nr:hypothetical protein [Mesorhizobium sediminum]